MLDTLLELEDEVLDDDDDDELVDDTLLELETEDIELTDEEDVDEELDEEKDDVEDTDDRELTETELELLELDRLLELDVDREELLLLVEELELLTLCASSQTAVAVAPIVFSSHAPHAGSAPSNTKSVNGSSSKSQHTNPVFPSNILMNCATC